MATIDFSNAAQAPEYSGVTTGDELFYGTASRTTLPVVFKMPYTSTGGSTPQINFKGVVKVNANSFIVGDGANNNLVVSSDNVGIGNNSPDARLTVNRNSETSGVVFAVRNTSNTSNYALSNVFTSGNGGLAVSALLKVMGNGFVETGVQGEKTNSVALVSTAPQGLSIASSNATGDIRMYSGGNSNEAVRLFSNKTFSIGDTHTAPDTTYRLRVSGNALFTGDIAQTGNQVITGTVAATTFSGSGASLTNIPWASVASRGNITTALTGDVTGTVTNVFGNNVSVSTTLANSGVTGATYGSTSLVPQISVNSKGIVTSASNVALSLANLANSTTSTTISIASKTIFVETGKQFAPSQWVIVSSKANPQNFMSGPVTSYNTVNGQLIFVPRASSTSGSGTYADWTVILAGPNAATSSIQTIAYANRNDVRTTTVDLNIIIMTLGLFTYVEGSSKTDDDTTVFNAVTGTGKYELVSGKGASVPDFVDMSSNTTAVVNGPCYIISGTDITLTLPATPTIKDTVEFIFLGSSTNLYSAYASINPNGLKIMGVAGTMKIDQFGAKAKLVYTGTTYGWIKYV